MNKNVLTAGYLAIIILIIGVVFMMNGNRDSDSSNNSNADNTEENTINESEENDNTNSESTNEDSFTTEEVAEHDSASDCWMIIEGNVYDVTEYVPIHPGGEDEISRGCGKDATVLFNEEGGEDRNGHPVRAQRILSEYQIGVLAD